MSYPILQIGSKVRIVSKANVRYEGTFVEIDADKLQIALCDVHFYGTEARAAEFYIAGQTRVYPFVVFKNTDIKEIVVLENPLEVARMTSFSSSSGISTASANPFNSTATIRRPYERDYPFEDQSFYNLRVSNNNNRNFQRTSQYLWRIPRVVDYVGRSGDPKELPLVSNGDFIAFEQDYDFEKYNKLFVDLCGGLIDLSLTNASNKNNNSNSSSSVSGSGSNSVANTDESQEVETNEKFAWNLSADSGINESSIKTNKTEEDSIVEHIKDDAEENVAIIETIPQPPATPPPPPPSPPSKGAIPKKISVYQSPKLFAIQSTAYDKSKSFFDTVSCSSIYRSGTINPNWREHNTETFGIPMICHQRRSARNFRNSSNLSTVAEIQQKQQQQQQQQPRIQSIPFANKPFYNNGRRYNNMNNNYNNNIHYNYNNNNNVGNNYNNDSNMRSQFTIKKVHFKAVFMSKNSTPTTKQEQNVKNIQTETEITTAGDEIDK